METVTVNKETLQKLLNYVSESEANHYEECVEMGLSNDELKTHAYALFLELQSVINAT